ncbi:uncharacterized protein LOC131994703 [Stomoxys calcitrans]|uniref:uncharacterized protein LOC131994703 n=1 Tax=Stomoxys calcitrans TaxID=35570 RepID=UPI0027E24BAD|nr:uncharacterized protein LOC131994703 [Stomoxys calcitrans]
MKILWSTLVGALFCHLAPMAWTLLPQRQFKPFRHEASAVEDDSIELTQTTTLRSPSVTSPTLEYYLSCEQEQYIHEFINESNQSQMLWVTWNRTKAGENAVLPNMCSAANGLPLRRRCYVVAMQQRAQWEPHDNNTVMIQCHRSMFCEEEKFEHFYIEGEDHLQPHVNVWKRTRINQKATLKDVCLKPNGLPLTRKCLYNAKNRKAQWTEIKKFQHFHCLRTTKQPIISNDLNTLLGNVSGLSTKSRRESSRRLINLLENPLQRRLPADIHLTNEILKGLIIDFPDPELSADVLHITQNLMASEPNVLLMSAELNATNSLLDTFESYMDNIGDKFVNHIDCGNMTLYKPPPSDKNLSMAAPVVEVINTHLPIGVYAHVSGNLSVFFVNPQCAGISGIAIYPSKLSAKQHQQQHILKGVHYDSFNDFHYRFIALHESAQELLHDSDLQVAAFVPFTMWQHLHEHFSMMDRSPVLVFKVYAHDGLFVESTTRRLRKPHSKVLSISIPGYEAQLPEDLPFLLRQHGSTSVENSRDPNTGCGYWNYSTWTSVGVQTTNKPQTISKNPLLLCYTNHLTQFSYLVGGNFKQNDFTDEILITSVHQEALDIISLVGCSLSLLGLIGIWITAAVFKSWRAQASNKVLLNLCVALTLQMVLFLFVNTDDVSEALVESHHYTKCVFVGALLQYSILVLFTWMLLIAFLQFQRYVTVIGIQRPKHYIAKSAILAWGLPLIPTILVATIDPKSYVPPEYQLVTDTGICYPSGPGLHFGVILPVSLIVAANLAIFIYVFYSISRTLSMSLQRSEKKLLVKQIRLSILLFFLLGLSWIFGLFAFMKMGIAFSYLFCLTATMQGFVLFVYFVILDEGARKSWQKVLCPHRAQKAHEKAKESQSMTTASTSNGAELSRNNDRSHSIKNLMT